MKVNNYKYNYSFSLAFILSKLDINLSENASSLTQLSFSVFLLSLISFLCVLNIIGVLTAYIFIQKGNYENKYPRFGKLINYYKQSSLLYVIIEIIICLVCLLLLIFYSLAFVLIK